MDEWMEGGKETSANKVVRHEELAGKGMGFGRTDTQEEKGKERGREGG